MKLDLIKIKKKSEEVIDVIFGKTFSFRRAHHSLSLRASDLI